MECRQVRVRRINAILGGEKYRKHGRDKPERARAKMRSMTLRTQLFLASAAIVFASCAAKAQENPDKSNLPDAPKAQQNPGAADQNQQKNPLSTSLGLIARKSYVYPDLATSSGPLSSMEKFELFVSKTVAAPQILSSAAAAGISEARGTLSGYGQGGEGFGKRFGAFWATGASSQFFGTFVLPAALHEDPRFFVRLNGGWKDRVGHALRRVVVIRTDAGVERFNLPGILGPLLAESLANTYLPDNERTASKTFQRYGIRIGFGAANNLLKEYWPSIFKSLKLNKVVPPGLQPDPNPPPPPGGRD
jgi:hypothetical protein